MQSTVQHHTQKPVTTHKEPQDVQTTTSRTNYPRELPPGQVQHHTWGKEKRKEKHSSHVRPHRQTAKQHFRKKMTKVHAADTAGRGSREKRHAVNTPARKWKKKQAKRKNGALTMCPTMHSPHPPLAQQHSAVRISSAATSHTKLAWHDATIGQKRWGQCKQTKKKKQETHTNKQHCHTVLMLSPTPEIHHPRCSRCAHPRTQAMNNRTIKMSIPDQQVSLLAEIHPNSCSGIPHPAAPGRWMTKAVWLDVSNVITSHPWISQPSMLIVWRCTLHLGCSDVGVVERGMQIWFQSPGVNFCELLVVLRSAAQFDCSIRISLTDWQMQCPEENVSCSTEMNDLACMSNLFDVCQVDDQVQRICVLWDLQVDDFGHSSFPCPGALIGRVAGSWSGWSLTRFALRPGGLEDAVCTMTEPSLSFVAPERKMPKHPALHLKVQLSWRRGRGFVKVNDWLERPTTPPCCSACMSINLLPSCCHQKDDFICCAWCSLSTLPLRPCGTHVGHLHPLVTCPCLNFWAHFHSLAAMKPTDGVHAKALNVVIDRASCWCCFPLHCWWEPKSVPWPPIRPWKLQWDMSPRKRGSGHSDWFDWTLKGHRSLLWAHSASSRWHRQRSICLKSNPSSLLERCDKQLIHKQIKLNNSVCMWHHLDFVSGSKTEMIRTSSLLKAKQRHDNCKWSWNFDLNMPT